MSTELSMEPPKLLICGQDVIPSMLAGIEHPAIWAILTLTDADQPFPPWCLRSGALGIAVDDVSVPRPGYVAAQPYHLRRVQDWARKNVNHPWIVHCAAGISRSPAAATVARATLHLDAGLDASVAARAAVQDVCEAIEETECRGFRSHTVHPNPRFLLFGDEILDCSGHLVAAALEAWPQIRPTLDRARVHLES